MAILNYIYVTCAATPISPDSPIDPRHINTKLIILPNKSSSGLPHSPITKLRKYWGGQEEEDPLTSDDFMWNKDFLGRFKSLEVDLSKELSAPANHNLDQQIEAATEMTERKRVRWRLAPTRREQEKWDRATKAATGGSDVMFRELRRSREDPKVLAAQSDELYAKRKLQIFTLGIGGVGLLSAYVSYSPEIAFSFGAGLLGSLVYIRMLESSVDSLKTNGAKGLVKGEIGQPRLLVPVVLVMIYNRWNALLVTEYGSMHLELIPMLVGFFTYKIATFVHAIGDALTVSIKKS